jgi:hypothetical protein
MEGKNEKHVQRYDLGSASSRRNFSVELSDVQQPSRRLGGFEMGFRNEQS